MTNSIRKEAMSLVRQVSGNIYNTGKNFLSVISHATLSPNEHKKNVFKKMDQMTISRKSEMRRSWTPKSTGFLSKIRNHTIGIIIFYVVGVYFFAHYERWGLLDSVYFVTVTTFSVGYGDFHPTKDYTRTFASFYMIFGLIYVATFVGELTKDAVLYAQDLVESTRMDRKSYNEINKWKYTLKTIRPLAMIFGVILFGAFVMLAFESDWTFNETFYFATVTTLTVGYGDYVPSSENSRVFVTIYIFIIIAVFNTAAADLIGVVSEYQAEKKKIELMNQKIDYEMISKFDTDGHGVDKFEFVVGLLCQLEVLDYKRDVDPWIQRFCESDVDGSGLLDKTDLLQFHKDEVERVEGIKQREEAKRRSSIVGRAEALATEVLDVRRMSNAADALLHLNISNLRIEPRPPPSSSSSSSANDSMKNSNVIQEVNDNDLTKEKNDRSKIYDGPQLYEDISRPIERTIDRFHEIIDNEDEKR